jgi:RNA polymerase sigma-70 factor (ECF subfamily)
VNACISAQRYKRRHPEVRMADLGEEEERVIQSLATSEAELDSGMQLAARDLVQHLLARLNAKNQIVIRLVYLEGFSIREVSQATGWSEGAVTMRIKRAKEIMRKHQEILIKEGGYL